MTTREFPIRLQRKIGSEMDSAAIRKSSFMAQTAAQEKLERKTFEQTRSLDQMLSRRT